MNPVHTRSRNPENCTRPFTHPMGAGSFPGERYVSPVGKRLRFRSRDRPWNLSEDLDPKVKKSAFAVEALGRYTPVFGLVGAPGLGRCREGEGEVWRDGSWIG